MRAKEFIFEDAQQKQIAARNLAEVLADNCIPYLQEMSSWRDNKWLLRGMEAMYATRRPISEYTVPLSVRLDRRPRDTNVVLHQLVDDWQLKNLGFRARSSGLFVTGSYSAAINFGLPYVVFPKDNFNYAWAENITDMTLALKREIGLIGYSLTELPELKDIKFKVASMLKHARWHKNEGMELYLSKFQDHEMTVNCQEYYIVPFESLPNNISINDLMPILKEIV